VCIERCQAMVAAPADDIADGSDAVARVTGSSMVVWAQDIAIAAAIVNHVCTFGPVCKSLAHDIVVGNVVPVDMVQTASELEPAMVDQWLRQRQPQPAFEMQRLGPFFYIVVGLNADGEASGMPAVVVASRMSWPSFAAEAVAAEHAAELWGPRSVAAVAPVAAVTWFDRGSVAVVCKCRLPG